ncbi:uncharacterized protein TNCV_4357041 [Trichonephila clavipes]|nr:uncharacterized protein TNCV_4357041 [Trichonephila clavipes]
MMDQICICETLAKRNEINPFLKRMVTEDEKLVAYNNIVRKRSWSKRGEAAQTVTKSGLTTRKLGLVRGNKYVYSGYHNTHVDVHGNEATDELAGRGCNLSNPSSTVLTHSGIPFFERTKMNLTWRNPPAHHWYADKCPDLSIQCRSSRGYQTALACFRSDHLRSIIFVQEV